MFITTENGSIVNSRYILNISSTPIEHKFTPWLVKITTTNDDAYYVKKFAISEEAVKFIDELKYDLNRHQTTSRRG